MKTPITTQKVVLATLIGLIVLTSGCATTGYWADRRRDAMDIFTFQVGYGLGAKARVGPIQTGLLADIGGVGVRGGEVLGFKDFWPEGYDEPAKQDYVGMVVGTEAFGGNDVSNRRGKSFGARQVAFVSYPMTHLDADQQAWLKEHHMVLNPAPYYSQIEIVAAAGVSFRIGFNPGELLDFFLGWFGVDIYHDDLSKLKTSSEAEQNDRRTRLRFLDRRSSGLPQNYSKSKIHRLSNCGEPKGRSVELDR